MDYISIIADVAAAVAVVIALITFKHSAKTYNEDKLHEKRKDTLDAYHSLQTEVFDNLFLEYKAADIEDIAKHYIKRNVDYRKLSTYTAKIEHFCVGVVMNIYDVEVVYELGHGFFDKKVREAIQPLMERKLSLAEHDPFENTRKVYQIMDEMTEARNQ